MKMGLEEIKRELLAEADKRLDDIADFIFQKSQETVAEKASDEGTLLKSGYVERKPGEKTIGYRAPYAAAIEFGTDPHMPPVEPLQKWAKRKLGLNEKESRKAAWGIAINIKEKGSEPVSFLRGAVKEAEAKFSR